MKKLLCSLALLFSAQLLVAQVDFGVKGGVNLQQVNLSDFDKTTLENVETGERELGYHAGIFANISLPFMFLQPEVVFTQINNTFSVTKASEDPKSVDVGFHRVDVPLIGGVKFGPLRLGLGPVASFNLGQQGEVLEDGLQNSTWGYQVGVGVNILKVRLDARYEGPFTRSASSVSIEGETYNLDARTNQIVLSIGYVF